MTRKTTEQTGFVRVAVAVVALVGITLGLVYFAGRDDVDVAQVGDTVVEDLSRAATTLQVSSEDAVTTAKVKTAFAMSKSVSAFDISVDSRRGVVTLVGEVPSEAVEEAAARIARDTSGVGEVVDQLVVDPGLRLCDDNETRTNRVADPEVKALIYEKFLRTDGFDAKGIEVIVMNRVVTLTGAVGDELSANRAETIAGSVAGVESVRCELRVDHAVQSNAFIPESDEILVVDVHDALETSGAIALDSVAIDVRSGLVTMRGVVRSESEKQLAEMLAGSVEGIVGVVNDLQVS